MCIIKNINFDTFYIIIYFYRENGKEKKKQSFWRFQEAFLREKKAWLRKNLPTCVFLWHEEGVPSQVWSLLPESGCKLL